MDKKHILLVFKDEDNLVESYSNFLNEGIVPTEVYTPYPVHGVLERMPFKTKITYAAFIYGALAVVGILGFLYYAAVISWPLNYGGKPFNSFPSFIVVTIVATILAITLLTLFTFSARSKIFPGKKPEIMHPRATDDCFVIVFDEKSWNSKKDKIQSLINGHCEIE